MKFCLNSHAAIAAMLLSIAACGGSQSSPPDGHAHTEDGAHDDHGTGGSEAEVIKGPNGGRLLEAGDFAIEVTIFESGVEPQYRLYASLDGKPVDPDAIDARITLGRLGGKTNIFSFSPQGAYLVGDAIVGEPHSFDVTVDVTHDGKVHNWAYESHEGRVSMPDAIAKEAGVETGAAGPARIVEGFELSGSVSLTPAAKADVKAVYPGRVVSVTKSVGDSVRKGETLAQIESASSLQIYAVRAPISGTVLERNTNNGDVASEAALFVLADLSALQAELHVFPRDAARIKTGQTVTIKLAGGGLESKGVIDGFLPLAEANTQSIIARVKLVADSGFRPGMRVSGAVETASTDVLLAVRTSGLQRFRNFDVVFAKHGTTYEVRMLELGRSDDDHIEVLGGIDPGETYVTANSFLIKADIEKSGASHDH
jgi:membrane fusion protein, heavy metal efflux system